MICWLLLVPAACFSHSLFFGSIAYLHSFSSSLMTGGLYYYLLTSAGCVCGFGAFLFFFPFPFFFSQKTVLLHHDLLVALGSVWGSGPGWGSDACLPFSFFPRTGVLFLHGFAGSSCFRLGSGTCLSSISSFFGSCACRPFFFFFVQTAASE